MYFPFFCTSVSLCKEETTTINFSTILCSSAGTVWLQYWLMAAPIRVVSYYFSIWANYSYCAACFMVKLLSCLQLLRYYIISFLLLFEAAISYALIILNSFGVHLCFGSRLPSFTVLPN